LRSVVRALRRHYGKPAPPVSQDPFRLILWEQVAYLVSDEQRRTAYEALRTRVGLAPEAILAAPTARLRAVTRLGGSIAFGDRAQRLRRSAERVVKRWGGNLRTALTLPLTQARRALVRFDMIGEPGADRILAFTGTARLLALDSNALRVLQRLDLVAEARDYRASYRQAQAALAPQLPANRAWLIGAAQLLRHHGQRLCRTGAPDCAPCPLRRGCPVGRARAI
jgi:endonuclease-3